MQLLLLVNGIVSGGSGASINTSQLSINGSRTLNSEVRVDGASVLENQNGIVSPLPSPDALQEFRVSTSAYSAESGRSSGGTVTAIIKSGTNLYHGSLYELFRNEDMDADNFFNNVRGLPRGADRYNQYGGAFGGPVWIPKIYNGRNKTFFFYNLDQTLSKAQSIPTNSVPSAAFKSGDFSSATILVYDPTTKKPFPGNIIPVSRIDPVAAKVMSLVPLPNTPGTYDPQNSRYINNFIYPQVLSVTDPKNTGKLDQAIGDRIRLFFSINSWATNSPTAASVPSVILNNALYGDDRHGFSPTLGYTQVISPTFVTEIHFALTRWVDLSNFTSLGTNVQQALGIGTELANLPPEFTITSYLTLGPNSSNIRGAHSNTYQLSGTNTHSLGAHSLRYGAELRKIEENITGLQAGGNANGVYGFSGSITNSGAAGGNAIDSLADFLLGTIDSASYETDPPETSRRGYNMAYFAQDDWKASARLTVNLGLRWEYESPVSDVYNILSRFDPSNGNLLVAGQNASKTTNITTGKRDFGPRLGVAYRLTDKTVLRTGFGMFYSGIFPLVANIASPGFNVIKSFISNGTGFGEPFTLSQGMPVPAGPVALNPQAILAGATPSNPIASPNELGQVGRTPSVQQWNFGLQQDVGKGVIVEANYVGNHSVHLPIYVLSNEPAFSQIMALASTGYTVTVQDGRPFPNLGAINEVDNVATANYHSLQVKTRREFTSNLAWLTGYTWSKSIDDSSGIYSFATPSATVANGQFPNYFRTLDRGVSSFNAGQSLSMALQYKTSGPRWVRNFQVSPVFIVRSGLPLNVSQTNEAPGVQTQRPDQTGANGNIVLANSYGAGPAIQYLQSPTSANFPLSPSGPIYLGAAGSKRTLIAGDVLGNLGRNTVTAPGVVNLNLSVARNFQLREHLRLQFRVDALNATNHVNFGFPVTALTVATSGNTAIFNSPGFGQITSAASARTLQIVTRVTF